MAGGINKVVVSLGTSVFNSDIVQKEISIAALFKRLSKPLIQTKKDGKYFIFASFKTDKRNAASVDKYYGATIDLDNTKLTVEEIEKKFAKYRYAIYTTFSHKQKGKGDRYRLVLPYKMAVDAVTHVETMLYLMHTLGATNVDLSSKALSRPMYLPATNEKRAKHFQSQIQLKGLLFNPLSESTRDKIALLQFEQGENTAANGDKPFDINEKVDEGGRNDALARAVGKFIKTGVANEEIYPLAQAWSDTNLHPALSSKEVNTIVDSIIKSHTRNHGDTDWGYDEIINRIKKSTDIQGEYDRLMDMIVLAKTKGKFKPSQHSLLIIELAKKSKVGQRVIKEEIVTKELELASRLETAADGSFESVTESLRGEFKNWVYVATDDRVYNFKTGEYYKREAFAAMFANPNVEGSLFGLVMKYSLMKKVSKLEFDPAQEDVFYRGSIKFANTYIPPEIFPIEGDVSLVINHFKYLIPNERECDILLDFIAHLVQKPGVKIRWMPVIKGRKGIGKTIIAESIMLPMIGFANFGKVSNEVIRSDFNSWQLDVQLLVFEELDVGGSYKEKRMLTDKLKSFITDNILLAHRKGLDPYNTINKCNSMGFTNTDEAIIISPDERRFCMMRTDVKPRQPKYYQRLADFVSKNHAELYHYFLERDISKFNPLTAPETAYTKEIKGQSVSWPGSIINTWIEDDKHPFNKHGCLTHHHIVETIRAESSGRFKTYADDLLSAGSSQSRSLHYTLRNLGFEKWTNPNSSDGRIRIKNRLENVWILPEFATLLLPASKKTILSKLRKVKIIDENWHE